jgi:hypothetical protein
MYTTIEQPAEQRPGSSLRSGRRDSGRDVPAFHDTFQAPNAPNPHDVAEAIAKLVAQPKGSRPARTVVSAAFGSDIVNEQTAPVQAHVVETLGLSHLAKLA